MLAMQYQFELPADYDMDVIDRRVRDKGHLFDDLPGLAIKAFLSARRGDARWGGSVNRYAPFYVWSDPAAMVDFLCGERFSAVTRAFGWPAVRSWSVLDTRASGTLTDARIATRRIEPIRAFDDLAALQDREREANEEAIRDGALLAVAGFDAKDWQFVRFRLHGDAAPMVDPETTCYDVLHLSRPSGATPFERATR